MVSAQKFVEYQECFGDICLSYNIFQLLGRTNNVLMLKRSKFYDEVLLHMTRRISIHFYISNYC